ncbi:MAG: single-stranded-DNA-specific exonuclease RecJ [Fusobacterium sp.]|nr:single-stranded-DNA-specific exonuclease RecJ [Fusobacterium sp.]
MLGKINKANELVEKILKKRNILNQIDIKKFIKSDYLDFNNPFDFENMEEVIKKIISVRDNNQKIFIYGDYDVDGISGTAFLARIFQDLGIEVDYYIPNRSEIDYGVSEKNIDYFHKRNGKLVITVDTGYNSIEAVRYAKSLGIDIIVTDHHKTIKEVSDDEVLYLNPKLSDKYSFKYLSGAGVAFKLGQALYMKLNLDLEDVYKYLDIVMIGTIADVVPMIGENRIIIKNGLKRIKKTKIKGLFYLMNYLRLSKKTITTTDISYYVSPLINSLGRIGISRLGADFFIKEDDFDIYNIIEEMKFQNRERRNLEKIIYDDAMEMIKESGNIEKKKYLLLSSDKWHAGVIGVVSSKLSIKYNLPVVLIAFEGDYGKASCRSVRNISIFNILADAKDILVRFGGHDLAAGFTVHKDNLNKLKDFFDKAVPEFEEEKLNFSEKIYKAHDFEISLKEINENIFDFMKKMSPFGLENPHPLFFDKKVKFTEIKKFGIGERHFSGTILKDNLTYYTVGFDLAKKISNLQEEYDIVYYPEKIFKGNEEVIQIVLKDIKLNKDSVI